MTVNPRGIRTLCGVGAFVFAMFLLAHLLGNLPPPAVSTLLLGASGICAFWWWELGRRL